MIIYVDIDETICEYDNDRIYDLAKPILANIKKINKLYDNVNTIIYWTARGAVTGIDWHELTLTQLNNWGAKFHKLKLTKPHYDLLICDKAINSLKYFSEENE